MHFLSSVRFSLLLSIGTLFTSVGHAYLLDPCYDNCCPVAQPDCCAILLEGEVGFTKFTHMPAFSYGFLNSAGFGTGPNEGYTAHDMPSSPYASAWLGFELPSCILPFWIGNGVNIELGGTVWTFDDQINQVISYPGVVTGIPGTGAVFPLINGSGVFTSAAVWLGGNFNREYIYGNGEIIFRTYYNCFRCMSLEPFIGFNYEKLKQNHYLDATALAAAAPQVTLTENLNTNYYDFGGGVGLSTCLNPFLFYVEGGLYGSYASTDFLGIQLINAGVVIGNPVIGAIEVHDQKRILSYKFKGSLGVNWIIGRVNLGLVGRYEYLGYAPRVQNPSFPVAGGPARIVSDWAANYSLAGQVGVQF